MSVKQSEKELGIRGGPSTTKGGVPYTAPMEPANYQDEYSSPASANMGGEANTFPAGPGDGDAEGKHKPKKGY